MTYRDDLEAAEDAARENAERLKRLAAGAPPVPAQFHVEDDGAVLTIRWRWFKPAEHIPVLGFCIVWNLFPVVSGLISFLHVASGFVIAYVTAVAFLNSTVVRLDRDQLSARHGPLPWVRNCAILRADVHQLHVARRVSIRRAHWQGDMYWGEVRVVTYSLLAIDRSGRQRPLVTNLDDPGHAHFLETTLETKLGISDRAAP